MTRQWPQPTLGLLKGLKMRGMLEMVVCGGLSSSASRSTVSTCSSFGHTCVSYLMEVSPHVWIFFSCLMLILSFTTMSLLSFLLLWFQRLLWWRPECHHCVFSLLFAWQQLSRLPLYHGKPLSVSSHLWHFMYVEIVRSMCLPGYILGSKIVVWST